MAPKTPSHDKPSGEIFATFGLKSAIGKTTGARLLADLFEVTGQNWRGISVDRSERLPLLYPDKISQINLPMNSEGRLDPYARTRAFAALDDAIDKVAVDGSALLIDVGSGEYPHALLDHAARARLTPLLARRGMRFTALIVTTIDVMVMSDVPRLVEAVQSALPNARIVVVLNERSGPFVFAKDTEAEKVWARALKPVLHKHSGVTIPALPPGCWDRFEDQRLRFSEVGLLDPETSEADEKQLIGWTRETRSLAVSRHGDVAGWLHDAWTALSPLVADEPAQGDSNG